MPVGIQIRNNDGYLQIDSTYNNYAFKQKNAVTTTVTMVDTSYGTLNVTGLHSFPIVAARATAGAFAYVSAYNSGAGTATISFGARGPTGTSVTVYVFHAIGSSGSGYGFEIRNAAGDVVFDAMNKYMRVAGTLAGTPSNNGTDTQTVTLPSGKTYAVYADRRMAANRAVNQSPSPPSVDWWTYSFYGFFKVVSNVITIASGNFQATSFGGTTPPPEVFIGGTCFILDVTGY